MSRWAINNQDPIPFRISRENSHEYKIPGNGHVFLKIQGIYLFILQFKLFLGFIINLGYLYLAVIAGDF